jgi:hypothetical protein
MTMPTPTRHRAAPIILTTEPGGDLADATASLLIVLAAVAVKEGRDAWRGEGLRRRAISHQAVPPDDDQ